MAKLFNARLLANVCSFLPIYPTTTPTDILGADFIGAARATNKHLADAAVKRFHHSVKSAGVEGHSRVMEATVFNAAKTIAEVARCHDLVILGQAKPDEWDVEQIVETVLFGSGRPLLLVPYIQKTPMAFRCASVCWDGSRAAARALGDAMPFLRRAEGVHLLTITTGDAQLNREHGDIGSHLARHGVNAKVRRLDSSNGGEVSTILNHVSDSGTDFVVMGGYGHNRLREFILGGVTRGMLASMTVPVLMSH